MSTPELPDGAPLAEHLARELAPVWDADGRRWTYLADRGAYVCDDPDYSGPAATHVSAIPAQPTFASPPRE